MQTRPDDSSDWQRHTVEMSSRPLVGDYVTLRADAPTWHRVVLVVHTPNQEHEAQIVTQPVDKLAVRTLATTELSQRPASSLLTESEAAAMVSVSKFTIRRLIERGVLKASNFGTERHKVYRVHPDDLRGINAPSSGVKRRALTGVANS